MHGDEIKIIDSETAISPGDPSSVGALLGLRPGFASPEMGNILLQLAVSMRLHGRGGILLVVPADSEEWTHSVLKPIEYALDPAFSGLSRLLRKGAEEDRSPRWKDALRSAIDGIAGLTSVDGATVITANYELCAFGAKIIRRRGSTQVGEVIVYEPIEGGTPTLAEPAQLGGTRHLSAAQFVHDQHDSIALVASQDGRFTVFTRSLEEKMVHARRIDSLLL